MQSDAVNLYLEPKVPKGQEVKERDDRSKGTEEMSKAGYEERVHA